jgi:hypothetical protein
MRIEDVQARLDHLGEVAAEFLAAGADTAEEWSPEWMALNSIATQQAELHDLRSMLMGESDVEIQLQGGAEKAHRVEAGFLAAFLDTFQSTVSSVVQALTTGATELGPIPARAIDASTMRVASVAPGSFVIRLDGPERFVDVPMLGDDDEPLPEFDAAVARLMDVFDASQADLTGEELREAVIQLGGQRSSSHMMELARTIARSGTRAELVHRSEFLAVPRRSGISTGAAGRLHELLSETGQTTRVVVMRGTLSGVRWKNQTFDLDVPEGDDITTIHGSVVTAIRDRVRDLFDGPVRAELEETVTTGPAIEEPRTTYRLVDVRRADPE